VVAHLLVGCCRLSLGFRAVVGAGAMAAG